MPDYDPYGQDAEGSSPNAASAYAQYASSPGFQNSPPGNPFAALASLFSSGQGGSSQPSGGMSGNNQQGSGSGSGNISSGNSPVSWDNTAKTPKGQNRAILNHLWHYLFGPNNGTASQNPSSQPGQIQSQSLPPPPGSTQSSGPFGGTQPAPTPQPQASTQPASQISSAFDIANRINQMLGGPPNPPPPVNTSSYFPTVQSGQLPNFGAQTPGMGTTGSTMPSSGAQGATSSPFDYLNMGPPPPRQVINMRADGGAMPGFMRGGYPELYTKPIRQTFDSGGESYVGGDYGDANGRADNVNARLSPKEYVMDAETMALLGDGNPDDGAKKMDELRSNIRKHKGKNLAKGKISPDAKAASSYIAGNPMSDGLRRAGMKT